MLLSTSSTPDKTWAMLITKKMVFLQHFRSLEIVKMFSLPLTLSNVIESCGGASANSLWHHVHVETLSMLGPDYHLCQYQSYLYCQLSLSISNFCDVNYYLQHQYHNSSYLCVFNSRAVGVGIQFVEYLNQKRRIMISTSLW